MLVNCTIDKSCCDDTNSLQNSEWNQALIYNLATHCEEIVAACPDRLRFGSALIDWQALIQERFYRIYLALTKAQPLFEGETVREVKNRLLAAHIRRKRMNAATNSKHVVRDFCGLIYFSCVPSPPNRKYAQEQKRRL
jgi:hypothetical protein